MTVKINDTPKGHTYRQWIFAMLANAAMMTYGLQCGWIAVTTPALQASAGPARAPLSDRDISWLASAPAAAAVFSVSMFAILADRIGRKYSIMILGLLQTISWAIKLCTVNTICLIISQMIYGVAGGGCFNIIPMYVKEISQSKTRGKLGVMLAMSQNVGFLAIFSLGGALGYSTVLWCVVWLPALAVALTLGAPESPAYLVKIGKVDDAASTIAYLRGVEVHDKNVQSEIDSIKSEDEKFKSIANVSFVGIFKQRAWCKGFVFMFLVMLAHGFNGSFAIVSYATIILKASGVTVSPELISLCIPVVMLSASLFSMFCIERLGRRAILGGAFGISVVAFSSLSAILVVQAQGDAVAQWLPVAAILLGVSAYAAGVSPMPFIIMSEMFNFQIRGKVMGVLVTTGWASAFVVLMSFAPVASALGSHAAFLFFAATNACGVLFVFLLIPETKGKSVEQIEHELDRKLTTKK